MFYGLFVIVANQRKEPTQLSLLLRKKNQAKGNSNVHKY